MDEVHAFKTCGIPLPQGVWSNGIEPAAMSLFKMPKLATYLGHSSVVCTYWYLEAVPELLELATEFQRTSIQGGR